MRSDRLSVSKTALSLAMICAVAALLRLWDLGGVPLAPHPDELAPFAGVRDMFTGHRPVAPFIASDVVYLPLIGVLQAIATAFFGESTMVLRLPSALLGVATALGTALLAGRIARSRLAAIAAGAIMAILPWDISLSRLGWEPAAMLPALLFGLYLTRRALDEGDGRLLLWAAPVLGIGFYSYRAAAFDEVVLTATMLALNVRTARKLWRSIVAGSAIAAAFAAPLVIAAALNRAYLSSGPAQFTFAPGINAGTLETFWSRYLAQFALLPLFGTGDGNLQHGPDTGVLYWWMLPFIITGFVAMHRLARRADIVLFYVWLTVYPVGNALVSEVPMQHFVRALIGAPLCAILAAFGIVTGWRWLLHHRSERWRIGIATAFAMIVFYETAVYCNTYFNKYPPQSASVFQYGNREMFAFIRAHAAEYDRVCFTTVGGWNWTTLTRYYFSDTSPQLYARIERSCAQKRTLFAVSTIAEAPRATRLIGTAQAFDGTTFAFFFLQ